MSEECEVSKLVVNRTVRFGSASTLLPNCSVRFGSADFFRLLLNSSVRFAEQFGKILAEQFGSVRFGRFRNWESSVRFGSARKFRVRFTTRMKYFEKSTFYNGMEKFNFDR